MSKYEKIVNSIKEKNYEELRKLLSGGYDVNSKSESRLPILFHAIGMHDLQAIEILKKNGAKANATNNVGLTAREYAGLEGLRI